MLIFLGLVHSLNTDLCRLFTINGGEGGKGGEGISSGNFILAKVRSTGIFVGAEHREICRCGAPGDL